MSHALRPRRTLTRLAAGAATAVLLLAGCTGADPESGTDEAPGSEGGTASAPADGGASSYAYDGPELEELGTSAAQDLPADPAEDPAYAEYYAQEIEWGECEGVTSQEIECGTVTVPLVWNDPGAGDIEIAVGRLPATGESTGPLVTNPGGPGGSGVNFLESAPFLLSPEVRAAYDVVGFDPRGVQRSAGVECLGPEETSEYMDAAAPPGTPEAEELAAEWNTRVVEACQENSGDVLPYLDTYSAARDMDVIRAALGAEQLDYLGYSYGTSLGATFADLYPERVGRFVLDGAVDPTLSLNQFAAAQVEGFERAVEVFLADCLEVGDSCPFTGTEEEAKQQLLALFASLDVAPVDSGDPERPVTGMMARSVVISLMYEDALWPTGHDVLTALMKGDGAPLRNLSDTMTERRADGTYRTNSMFALPAVRCLDRPQIADRSAIEEQADRLAEEFPTFGPVMAGEACVDWPVPPMREPAPLAAEGAGPIVVIGTTGDPATPYVWAENLVGQLDDAVLLTFEGNGHTAYGRSGGCIEEQVDAYLLEGTVPEDGLTC